MSENIIQMKDVNKWFGDFQVLKDINLEVGLKQKIVVCGPSGSGKSTLMNIIGCLDVPSSGDYFFRENNISSYNSNKLAELRNKDIGFIFQNFNLLPRLNALENVWSWIIMTLKF